GFTDGRLWESCMTMNDTWGYARNDHNWKSEETLIHNLIDIASKGGNYLLNVGPTELGEFPDAIDQRLAAMGRWMAVNGEAIYGTTSSPFAKLLFNGRCTHKGNILYLHVFQWPDFGLLLDGLTTRVLSARVLGSHEKLRTANAGDNRLFISQPKTLDPI